MKKFLFALCFVAMLLQTNVMFAARSRQNPQQSKIEGSVMAADGTPVAYATVVLLAADGTQKDGVVTDAEGKFSFTVQRAAYKISVSYMGYEPVEIPVDLKTDVVLEPITLSESATQIDAVTIKGRLITREADRFVMNNISESPLAAGRDTYEMLSVAPGVYAKDGEIKINGKGGTKIYLNEREVRMSGEELMNYLKAIPAENIQKIEVIPISGAEYDADTAGGIIKITVKKQRNDGMSGLLKLSGSLGMSDSYTRDSRQDIDINYNRNKLNIYANGSYYTSSSANSVIETTDYATGQSVNSTSSMRHKYRGAGAMVGAVYDINERNSIGAEYNIWSPFLNHNNTESNSDYVAGNTTTRNQSIYNTDSDGNHQSLTVNYIHKLDTLGSYFKLIGDYARNVSDGMNNYRNTATLINGAIAGDPVDSIYRNVPVSDYRIYTLTAGVEKKLSPVSVLKYGAKYTLADTYSKTDYSYQKNSAWVDQTEYNQITDYQEHISALYATYSTRFSSGISLSAGLRGEYTVIPQLENQNYFSLFPNANISVPLNQKQTVILIGTYARSISRPPFWAMNPQRTQLSQYSYQVGNPDLHPSFGNNLSLTGVLFYKYTLTVGGNYTQNSIQQICMVDPQDNTGRTLKYYHVNMNNMWQYYAALNAPINITDWWNLNLNLTAVNMGQQISDDDSATHMWSAFANGSTTVTLPNKWFIDVDGYYMSGIMVGNLHQLAQGNISLKVKKRFWNDRFTASVGISNILNTSNQTVLSEGVGFNKRFSQNDSQYRTVNLSLTYNFKSGKMFKAKSVESGAADEKGRMGGSSK